MAKNQKVPSNVQEQINKQVAEAKAKAEQAKANAMANGAATAREEARAAAIAKAKGTTTKEQVAEAFNTAETPAAGTTPASTQPAATTAQTTATTQPATTATQTPENSSLSALRAVYETFNNYTPKTDEEIRAQAEGETKSKYDLLTTSARQAQEKEDLALAQQREGLGTSYDRQRENTNRTYDSNRSAADRQALSRGMQRSSYNNQTLANIDSERARALRDIDEAQTTAEGNIDAQRAQLASQLAETERSYTQAQADDILARTRELQDQEYERKLKADQIRAELASDLYGKEYQLGRDAITDAFNEKQFAFQQEQAEIQQAQWREQFDYQQKSDDQKIAMQYAMSIIQAGGTPSDDLLARAGLSRSDANAMLHQVEQNVNNGYTGSYGSPSAQKPGGTTGDTGKPSDDTTIAELDAYWNGNKTTGLIKGALDAVSSGAKTAQINSLQNDINQLSKQFATALTDTERANINNQIMNKQNEINKIKNGQTQTNSLKNDSIKRG